jgi:nicotinamidase-related amidase
MTSAPVRDPLADHLLTPQNAALLLIDYQPSQLAGVHSMDRDLLVKNAVELQRDWARQDTVQASSRSSSPTAY